MCGVCAHTCTSIKDVVGRTEKFSRVCVCVSYDFFSLLSLCFFVLPVACLGRDGCLLLAAVTPCFERATLTILGGCFECLSPKAATHLSSSPQLTAYLGTRSHRGRQDDNTCRQTTGVDGQIIQHGHWCLKKQMA